MRRPILLPALLAISAPLAAQSPAISVDTLKEVTQTLSSDTFEGRAPTTPAEGLTIGYIAGRLSAAGIKPGNKGDWFQKVPMVELNADSAMHLDISGGAQPLSFAYKTDMVATSYRVVPETRIANSDVVFVGYGINAPERGWNDYKGVDVKGKTVIILVNDPDYDAKDLKGPFEGRAMTYYGRWTYKFEEAARQGAAAAFIIHDTYPAAYPWSVVVSSWTGPQLSLDPGDKPVDATQANGWITGDAATRLMAASGKSLPHLMTAARKKGFKAVPLGVKANLGFSSTIRRQQSSNVIGILPGKTRPDEYVLYSAHWDHLGRCEAVNGDDICNGAIDNASGVAGLVALAEAHAKAGAPDRSILFLAVTGEESGLLGSAWYGTNPVYPHARTVAGINMDGLNTNGRTRDVTVIGAGKSELEPILARHVAAQSRSIMPESAPEKGFFYRSDHFSLAKQGVPMIYFDSGEDLVAGGTAAGRAAAEDYTVNRYHKPQDEYRADWNWDGALEDLTLNWQIGRELADGTGWPNWYPKAEFRILRDKSRAGQ
ncbi:MAG: M28 family peptidase [Sphingomonadales bacterium]|nr:M28 family peptidase [Sphingomonadales bacterium]